jgi:hypothetical protein
MSRFQKYKEIYLNVLPYMTMYSTFLGINAGMSVNMLNSNNDSFGKYSNIIGYTTIGIVTGITYPVSYPLFGWYVIYKK